MPARLARWPVPVLLALVIAGLWALDTRQPAPWPDAATPWFTHVRALSPAAWLVDRLNAHAAFTAELPVGSTLLLAGIAACTLVALLAIEVPTALALAVALGVVATRSLWSTAAQGQDALPVAAVACAVMAVASRTARRHAAAAAAFMVVVAAPAASWLVAPVVAALPVTRARQWLAAAGLVGLSLGVESALLQRIWSSTACLDPGAWVSALGDVLRPGLSADASPWFALRQTMAVLNGDVHAFGLLVAAFGAARAVDAARDLRRATILAVALALLGVATGLLPPGLTAALLLPWWAPWFGRGLAELVGDATGRSRWIALAFGIVVALATPVLRHATVAAGPWRDGMPAVTRAVAEAWHDGLVVSEESAATRRLRLVGASTIPIDARTLDACLSSGRTVHALGATIWRAELLGHRVAERPLRAPLTAILQDVRPDQLVALALSPAAITWTGPRGLATLARIALTRDAWLGAPAIGIVARTDRGGDVQAGREGVDLSFHIGDDVGGRTLHAPVSVSAHAADARVDSMPNRLASGRHAALAVFDRAHGDVVARTVGEAAPGLPMPLVRMGQWRHGTVDGTSACVLASRNWTPVAAGTRRFSVPVAAASSRRPLVAYLAAAAQPQVAVTGLPVHPLWTAWSVDVFDTQVAADVQRLEALEAQDAVTAAVRVRARWVARVTVTPRDSWDADRVAVSAGVLPDAAIVRLAADGRRAAMTAVCPMASAGDLVLHGQYGSMDDETARELAVAVVDGWHPVERLRGEVFQWTSTPVATAAFRLDAPIPLTLALDATGAGTAAGPQPIVVRVNDRVVREDWVGAGRVVLPVDALRSGDNLLSLEVTQVVRPAGDTRALGVLVRQLRVITPEGR